MASHRDGAAANGKLGSLKAIQRVLRERNISAVKSTVWYWRWRLPPSRRPPIEIRLDRGRACVTASRMRLLAWVDRMERQGFFERSRRLVETHRKRRAIESGKAGA